MIKDLEAIKEKHGDLPVRVLETGHERVRDIGCMDVALRDRYSLNCSHTEYAVWLGW